MHNRDTLVILVIDWKFKWINEGDFILSISESLSEHHVVIVVLKEVTLHSFCIIFANVINDQKGCGLNLLIVVSLAIGWIRQINWVLIKGLVDEILHNICLIDLTVHFFIATNSWCIVFNFLLRLIIVDVVEGIWVIFFGKLIHAFAPVFLLLLFSRSVLCRWARSTTQVIWMLHVSTYINSFHRACPLLLFINILLITLITIVWNKGLRLWIAIIADLALTVSILHHCHLLNRNVLDCDVLIDDRSYRHCGFDGRSPSVVQVVFTLVKHVSITVYIRLLLLMVVKLSEVLAYVVCHLLCKSGALSVISGSSRWLVLLLSEQILSSI